ncbi:helix-turn-helix transcriptional regulator [Flavobacterium amniphilum]|uniref:helix-turn-helix domain-containing protein n=1 Tax=Flavobacterium amniphilum TaxID=1834035 RepID=UPI002029E953|nr:response regulator transcription factor [Flavobacterium amniphilum]MCL9806830.1 helix-turn-helix transcriptional regulator [Flavobacterium amniphilum]
MDKPTFLNNISSITIFILLLLAFFLLTVNTKNKLSNRLFAGFLLLTIFDLSSFFTEKYFEASLNFELFRMTISLLIMPIFYLYVKAVCHSDFRLKPNYLLLIIPFIIANLVFTPRLYLATAMENSYIFEHFKQMPEIRFFYIVVELQYVFYIILVFKTLKKYKEIYLENYTNANDSSYKWLFQMTVFFLIAHCIVFFRSAVRYTDYNFFLNSSTVIIEIIALLISCWFVLKALNNPNLFKGVDSNMVLVNKTVIPTEKESSQTPKPAEIASQIELVKKYVSENEPFLEPSLTIQELANQVNIPVRDLSVLINHHINQHFFDFINEYRIQKAMQILKNPSKNKLTVLEILYEVGFNSKSSFNTAFKKYTNQTPTEFRNS